MNHHTPIWLALLLLIVMPTGAQPDFRTFTTVQGLADNTVFSIAQTTDGFVWMGTANGLSSFDGMFFNNYLNRPEGTTSAPDVSDNVIRCVLPDADGLYLATDNGLVFFHTATARFMPCTFTRPDTTITTGYRFNSLVRCGSHVFAVDYYGHVMRRTADRHFEPIAQHGRRFDALAPIDDRRLVATGPEGIWLLRADDGRVESRVAFEAPVTGRTNIYYSHNLSLIVVGYGIGYASRAFTLTPDGRLTASSWDVPESLTSTVDYGDLTVFATDGGGIELHRADGSRTVCTPYNSNIGGDAVYTLATDRDANLWVGTYRMGLCLSTTAARWYATLSRKNHRLSYDIVTAVVPMAGRLAIGLDGGGLQLTDSATGRQQLLTTKNSALPGNNVVSIVADKERLWLGVYTKGLVGYDLRTGRFDTFAMPPTEQDANNVWTLLDDHRGRLWVGGPCLFVFDKQSHRITPIDTLQRADCMSLALSGDDVWMGCRFWGICKFDVRTLRLKALYRSDSPAGLRLPSNNISFLAADRRGRVWFSTDQGGFYRLDEPQERIDSFGIGCGLTNTHVTSMAEDADGNIFVGTSGGLFRYAADKGTFACLDIDADMSEFTPNCTATDGHRLYFGTTKGVVSFNPSDITMPDRQPGVCFTSLHVIGDQPLTIALGNQREASLRLTHRQNFFTVVYAMPEFVTPERLRFSCRLEGLETTWRELGQSRQASYTSVPPGRYRLLVRCSDADGQWGEPSVLSVVITPPWYLAWWARLLWTLLTVAVVYAAFRFYRRELSIKHKVEMVELEKASEQKLNDAKMNFYTSMTHELRTPVFLIMAQLEQLLDEGKLIVQAPRTYMADIHRHALKLNNLISRVIDFRKVGAAQLQLDLRRADAVELCRQLTESYADLFRMKHIDFSLEAAQPEIWLDYDPLKLELIVSNLLSNAFKYTAEEGRVVLSVSEEPQRVVFCVADNGIGIDPQVRQAIFDPFFRSERGKRQSRQGDGLGLAYVKQLVELHGGRISVESTMGRGSRFTFYIPRQPSAHPEVSISQDATPPTAVTSQSAESAPPSPSDKPQPPANPAALHSVLIADDDPDVLTLLERNLSPDFRVLKASDGEQALATAIAEQPDIIVCDLVMPHMDGQQLLTQLKTDARTSHAHTIILTARSAEDDMLSALDRGADAFLTKPISLRLLRMHIDRLLSSDTALSDKAPTLTPGNQPDDVRKPYNKEEQLMLTRLRTVIDEHLADPDFNIELLATSMNMSHSALYKRLKALTGMSLVEFINDYKIFKAVQLFRQGETSVEQVSEQCGFGDAKNFRSMFKRKMQMTPKQYIQSL